MPNLFEYVLNLKPKIAQVNVTPEAQMKSSALVLTCTKILDSVDIDYAVSKQSEPRCRLTGRRRNFYDCPH